jgi:hypothetical protein
METELKMVCFHDINNHDQKKYLDLSEYAGVESCGSGSAVLKKGSDYRLLVSETPDEVEKVIEEKNNE